MLTTCTIGMSNVASFSEKAASEAERAGAAIGTVVGLGMILSIWCFGAVILGLMVIFTRGQKTIEIVQPGSKDGRKNKRGLSQASGRIATTDVTEEIGKLAKLNADGLLSDEEFTQLKAKIIGG